MVNISIALAFLLSFFFSPGQTLVALLIDIPVLQSLPAGQRGIALAIAGYWLPATLIYLALRMIPIATSLKPTRGEAVALGIGNAVLILYVIARVFASTVEGGGAGFVVASFSVFTSLPALIIVGIVLLKLISRLPRQAGKKSDDHERTEEIRETFSITEAVAIVIIGFGPVAYVIATLSFGDNSPFQMARAAEKRMEELCAAAGEKIIRIPKEVEGVYLDQDVAARLERIELGVYNSSNWGIIGEPLVNSGWIRFFETRSYRKSKEAVAISRYERFFIRQKKEPVDELLSQYGVFRTKLTTSDDEKLGTEGYELSVKVLSTNEVTATSRYFYNRKTRRVCGYQTNNSVDEGGFIRRALGMERRFDSLWPK